MYSDATIHLYEDQEQAARTSLCPAILNRRHMCCSGALLENVKYNGPKE